MKKMVFALALGISQMAFATNLVAIEGKLTSISNQWFVIETIDTQYYIDRKAVSRAVSENLEKSDIDVAIEVPMEGITSIKPKTLKKGD